MKYKNFTADLKLSSIILGTDVYGTHVDRKCAYSLLDFYTQNGGNTIDTARLYGRGWGGTEGESERVIGSWMQERKNRHDVIISTKCSHPKEDRKSRLSREEIIIDTEASLKDLKTDYIDILWLHRDDTSYNAEEIISVLEDLKKQGKIRSYGASNWRSERIKEAGAFSGSQIKWSIAHSSPSYKDDPTLVEMDAHEYEFYKESKMPVFAYASQAKGFFQKYDSGKEAALSPKASERYLCSDNIKKYEELKEYCTRAGFDIKSAVCASLCANTDFPTFAIVGSKSIKQLDESMKGLDYDIDYNIIKRIIGF